MWHSKHEMSQKYDVQNVKCFRNVMFKAWNISKIWHSNHEMFQKCNIHKMKCFRNVTLKIWHVSETWRSKHEMFQKLTFLKYYLDTWQTFVVPNDRYYGFEVDLLIQLLKIGTIQQTGRRTRESDRRKLKRPQDYFNPVDMNLIRIVVFSFFRERPKQRRLLARTRLQLHPRTSWFTNSRH